MEIRLRLILGFAVLLMSIGILALVSANSVAESAAANDQMEHSRAQLDASLELSHEVEAYLTASLTEVISSEPDPNQLAVHRAVVEQTLETARSVREAEQEFESERDQGDESEDALLLDIETALNELDASFRNALAMVSDGDLDEGRALALTAASGPSADRIHELIAEGLDDERSEVESAQVIAANASSRVTVVSRIVSAATFGIVLLLLLWTLPPLSRSLKALHSGVERVSKGDLTSPIQVTGSHELARFGRAFNGMLDDLQEARLRQATEAEARAASRRAGMADVATGVLHNVGNVLNSLRVSVEMVRDELKPTMLDKLNKTVALLEDQGDDLSIFLADDPRGQFIVPFLAEVAQSLESKRAGLDNEAKEMQTRLAHIEMIIGKQQQHSRRASLLEWVQIAEVVEDATTILMPSFERHGVELDVQLLDDPQARLDRHQVLEMLINLLGNAKDAVVATGSEDRRVAVTIHTPGEETAAVAITDNGVGISQEALDQIFTYGFTTKDDGHGFGLHNAANAAKAIGGEILASSGGEGAGATFTLVLPVNPPAKAEQKPDDRQLTYAGNASAQ